MFERYTEASRRLIFFARYEASQAGSLFIEPEHFALAFLKDQRELIQRLTTHAADSLESAIRETPVSNRSEPAARGLPLSDTLKRVLALGAEAAERLNAPQIGPEHLLLGLIRDPGCAAVCSILEKHGITEAAVLREIGASDTSALEPLRPAISRETLSALVAALPERALNQAHAALTRLQVWPPAPPHVPERITEIQNEMHRRFQESARQGVGMIGGSGGAWRTDPQGKILNGSLSSARMENGAHVTETHRFFQGHEITIIERTRIREEEKLISYSQEIRGPGRQHRFEVDFEIG